MKTPIPVAAIVAGTPPEPIASENKKSARAKPAKSLDRQTSQMKENMKEMQQQMN